MGVISYFLVRHDPEIYNKPAVFAAIGGKGHSGEARVLEGPVPDHKKLGAAVRSGARKSSMALFVMIVEAWQTDLIWAKSRRFFLNCEADYFWLFSFNSLINRLLTRLVRNNCHWRRFACSIRYIVHES